MSEGVLEASVSVTCGPEPLFIVVLRQILRAFLQEMSLVIKAFPYNAIFLRILGTDVFVDPCVCRQCACVLADGLM